MHITIGQKIFAVAGLLIALMCGAALLTTWKVREVSNEVHAVAQHIMPLADRIAHVQAHLLRQEVVLQQMAHRFDPTAASAHPMDELRATFENLGNEVDAEIESAIAFAASARDAASSDEAKVALSRVGPLLESIEHQHQNIHDLVVRFLQARDEGKSEAVAALLETFEREQVQFDERVADLVDDIVQFGEAAALKAHRNEQIVLQFNVVVTVLAAVLGLLFAAVLTRNLVKPVRTLRDGTRAVETGDLSRDIPVTTSDEIADLTRAFNHMLEGLRGKERLKSMFGTYVDPRVVEAMLEGPQDGASIVDGAKTQATVFFSDIAGFTPIGERLSPVGLVRLMNAYLSLASAPIVDNGGVIDKYIGDAVMAFWCPPFVPDGEQARQACMAALGQFDQLAILRERLPDVTGLRKDLPHVDIRIGLASGEAVVGSVGSEYAKNFTVMGDTVNLGSRLEAANKIYGTRALLCERTRASAGGAIEAREIDAIAVHGKSEPMRVFELLAPAGGLTSAQAAARDGFAAGLAAYRARDWARAEDGFRACLAALPEDGPAKVLLTRIDHLRATPPADTWDGVWRPTAK